MSKRPEVSAIISVCCTNTRSAICLASLVLIAAAGCTGQISNKGAGPGASSGNLCSSGSAQPALTGARVRRLTVREIASTLTDLVGSDQSSRASALEPDSRASGFSTGVERTVTAGFAGSLKTLAEATASDFRTTVKTPTFAASCVASDSAARSCADAFIRDYGARAFRRPVADDEATALLAVYDAGRATGTDGDVSNRFGAGLEYTVRAILQSPEFVYRTELGPASAAPGSTTTLTPYEMASALSYTLLASPPDAQLTGAAAAGQLASADQIAAQARRLISDHADRFGPQLREFVLEWLGIDLSAPQWQKNSTLFPNFGDSQRAALTQETQMFLDDWVAGGSTLPKLLTSPKTFVNSANAGIYGMKVSSSTFSAVTLDPTQRAGIVTQPAFLGTYAHTDADSPVLRGVALMRKFFCMDPPPVPAMVPPLSPVDSTKPQTTRQRYEIHTQSTFCSACHNMIDPMGFAFENYDAIGAYRTQENSFPVDASGAIVGTPTSDQPVTGGVAMANALAGSADVQNCVARQLYRFSFGNREADDQSCAMQQLTKSYVNQGGDLRELIVAIVTSPGFAKRAIAADGNGAGGQ
jgi:hypothetical protein